MPNPTDIQSVARTLSQKVKRLERNSHFPDRVQFTSKFPIFLLGAVINPKDFGG
jgi:hypothetical protein